jgi:oligoribonuclease (3'-5' exoribonuclease)
MQRNQVSYAEVKANHSQLLEWLLDHQPLSDGALNTGNARGQRRRFLLRYKVRRILFRILPALATRIFA